MAHYTYEIKVDKKCPRCGCNGEAIVSVYYLGSTHTPQCKNCGLGPESGDHANTAKINLVNYYYKWEETHPKNQLV